MGGQVTYTYRDTTMANGGHDEDQLTHQDFETYLDGLYDCTAGKFITMNW